MQIPSGHPVFVLSKLSSVSRNTKPEHPVCRSRRDVSTFTAHPIYFRTRSTEPPESFACRPPRHRTNVILLISEHNIIHLTYTLFTISCTHLVLLRSVYRKTRQKKRKIRTTIAAGTRIYGREQSVVSLHRFRSVADHIAGCTQRHFVGNNDSTARTIGQNRFCILSSK